MLAEFELFAHERIAHGESLTADDLCEKFGQLNAEYYGPVLQIDEELKMEWARIPQFYSGFYVYNYATGFAASSALARQVLTEGDTAAVRVLDFLRSGSSEDPLPVLKRAGVDLTTPEPVFDALRVFRERLVELERLISP
jgi:oligoendopeptidase F